MALSTAKKKLQRRVLVVLIKELGVTTIKKYHENKLFIKGLKV
jgi:hypothetical protein